LAKGIGWKHFFKKILAARVTVQWSGSRFGKLKVPSLSRDDPAAVFPRARSLPLQLVALPGSKFCHA
jgi:hypothetical protein